MEQVVTGIPDIVVEVLTPGTVKKDRILKKKIYEHFGVPEFWVVDLLYRTVEIFRLVEGKYESAEFAEEPGSIKSSILEGLEIPLEQIFKKNSRCAASTQRFCSVALSLPCHFE